MALTIGLIVVVLIVAVLGFAATKPDTFRMSRSAPIDAPAANIFPLINNLRNWRSWSPYEKLDPDMQRTYLGAEEGLGAGYTWEGNNKAGAGRMEITESTPPSHVGLRLEFTRPFKAVNTTEFHLAPEGTGTRVTWSMFGPQAFMQKVMCIFVDMDKMLGKDFEAGLATLKAEAEGLNDRSLASVEPAVPVVPAEPLEPPSPPAAS